MQATATAKRFRFGWRSGALVMFGIAAAVTIGVARLEVTHTAHVPNRTAASVAAPKAFYSAGQGEGLAGSGRSVLVAAPKALYQPFMGEGRLNVKRSRVAATKAYSSPGMGEGIVGGLGSRASLAVPLKAYYQEGMGEGWLGHGRPRRP